MYFLKYIKYKILEWRWDRILKKSGYPTWHHYFYYNDPDYYSPGYSVKDKFCGYPFIVKVDYNKIPIEFDGMWGPMANSESIVQWCNRYCRGKFKPHWDRVVIDHAGQYLPNGIGGTDELFFGFKDERDYFLFLLRWS